MARFKINPDSVTGHAHAIVKVGDDLFTQAGDIDDCSDS